MLTDQEYDAQALPELSLLMHALDALEDDSLEAELSADILAVEFTDSTKYVINSHRAARQIWMAAERSAWHFDWEPRERRWVAKKTGDELWSTLERLLAAKLGRPVQLR